MKYTKEIIKQLEDAIRSGLSNVKACELVGINPTTLYGWMKEKSYFYNRIKKARAEKCKLYADTIKAAGLGHVSATCPECGCEFEVMISKAQWQAIAWLAERTEFDEFGNKQRVEHTGKDGEPIAIKEVRYHLKEESENK